MVSRAFLEKVHYGLVLLFLVTLPFTVVFNSIVVMLLAGLSLGLFFYFRPALPFRKGHALLAVGYYLWHLVGLLNSEDLKPVFHDLEQKASLLAFPIIWLVSPRLSESRFQWILKTFVLVTLLTSLLTFRHGFAVAWNDELIYQELLVHRPYLGMYCVVSAFFCLEIFRSHPGFWWRAFALGSILAFFVFLVVILAKMAVVCLVVVGVLYFLFRLYVRGQTKFLYFSVGGLAGLCLLALSLVPEVREVVVKLVTFEEFRWDEYNEKLVNSLNIRFVLWGCTFLLLTQDGNWLWGVGTGDAQPLLNSCYDATGGASFFSADSLISHNQYLTNWLNLGLPGLLWLLALLSVLLCTAIRRRQGAFFSFACLMILLLVPESVLEMQKGVVFFSFFYALFLFGRFPGNESPLGGQSGKAVGTP